MMATSMTSKTKLAFVKGVTESIVETQKKLNASVEELSSIANTAKYSAVDRVYNVIAELSIQFSEILLSKDKKVLLSISEALEKRTDIGTAFVSDAKKVKPEVEGIPSPVVYDKITAERDGSETWDTSMASRLDECLTAWNKHKLDFIVSFSESYKKIEEEEFKESVKPIGVANENFTNSIAVAATKIEDALQELNISIDKFKSGISEVSSSAGIGEANVKIDLQGADF